LFKDFWVAVDGFEIDDKLTADVNNRDKLLIVNPVDKVHRWCILVCTRTCLRDFSIEKNRNGANRIIRDPKEDELLEKPEVS
jgi:hypothetical protein